MMYMRTSSIVFLVLLVVQPFHARPVSAQEKTIDASTIERLEQLIKAQQQQLEYLQQQLNELKETAATAQPGKQEATSVADEGKAAEPPSEKIVTPDQWEKWAPVADVEPPDPKVVTSSQEQVKLSIYGMVNRAVNVVDDGKTTDAYFVDNDNAESRVGFLGSAKINNDLTIGSKIELTIAPDKAGDVNQNDKEAGDVFDQRWASVAAESKRYGKLSLGKGYTASYGTASRDLSKTNVISYVTVSDTAGGMLFRQKDDEALTNLSIAQAFQSFDGLNRRSRLRYDTPRYKGVQLSTSLLTDQRYDGALWWGGQGNGFRAIAAAAIADPKKDDADLQYDGSLSVLHEKTGLNLTLSTGLLERDDQSDKENYYAKLGWLKRFFPVGQTAFSIDYTRTENQPTDDDDGYSVGLAAVQHFEKYGSEIFFLYRDYSLDRGVEPDVNDISVISLGSRIKF